MKEDFNQEISPKFKKALTDISVLSNDKKVRIRIDDWFDVLCQVMRLHGNQSLVDEMKKSKADAKKSKAEIIPVHSIVDDFKIFVSDEETN